MTEQEQDAMDNELRAIAHDLVALRQRLAVIRSAAEAAWGDDAFVDAVGEAIETLVRAYDDVLGLTE